MCIKYCIFKFRIKIRVFTLLFDIIIIYVYVWVNTTNWAVGIRVKRGDTNFVESQHSTLNNEINKYATHYKYKMDNWLAIELVIKELF